MGRGRDEREELREKLRWVAAFTLLGGVICDFGLGAVLASILVLLGVEGVSWLLKR